jgi:hypothetical protein
MKDAGKFFTVHINTMGERAKRLLGNQEDYYESRILDKYTEDIQNTFI